MATDTTVALTADDVVESHDTVNGCGICSRGLVQVGRAMYACLCWRGQAKRGQRVREVSEILTSGELAKLWPDGAPAAVDSQQAISALSDAGVPVACLAWSLDTFRQRFKTAPAQRYVDRAATWLAQPVADRPDVVLFGPNGTGKTGLAVALARGAIERSESVCFTTVRDLSIRWRETYGDDPAERETTVRDELLAVPLLVLDEVSGLRLSEFVEDTLTGLIDARQKRKRPTVLTLNTPPGTAADEAEALTELLGPTLQDRLRERAEFWPLRGESQRRTYGRKEGS